MAERDANWFSSYFGWRKGKTPDDRREIADRARDAVLSNAQTAGDPSPNLKRVWRTLLRQNDDHRGSSTH